METLKLLVEWLTPIVAILAALAAIIRYWRIIQRKLVRPAWTKVKPHLKVLADLLGLVAPIPLIIYGLMYWASDFYAEAPAFLLTDTYAFCTFIVYEAVAVSGYVLLWRYLLGPLVRRRLDRCGAAGSPSAPPGRSSSAEGGAGGAQLAAPSHDPRELLAASQPTLKTGGPT